ncbi:MAG TPA: hypothetical protein VJ206_08515 [bacterium]|nr:hypothetical protein [bacterium]
MRPLLIAGLFALLFFSSVYAQNARAPRDQQATVYLQISKASPYGGTIKGLYNGTAVEGTYSGGAEGTFTLMANGMVLANGTYSCDASGCIFSGK